VLEVGASLFLYWCLPADLLVGVARTRLPVCREVAAENPAWPA
jgi:hypothetical protein